MTDEQWADLWVRGQVSILPVGFNAAITIPTGYRYREPRPEEHRLAPIRRRTPPAPRVTLKEVE
jgi:hypothetical protein